MTGIELGLFDSSDDIGDVGVAGSARFDGSRYNVSGSGYNMWFDHDAFHYLWTQVEGDLTLQATVQLIGEGTDPHRKAAVVLRSSLDEDAAYAGAAVHGDGLTSLQYRAEAGAETLESRAPQQAPSRIGIVKEGDRVYATVDGERASDIVDVPLGSRYYAGIAVCSHLKGVVEEAVFSEVSLTTAVPAV